MMVVVVVMDLFEAIVLVSTGDCDYNYNCDYDCDYDHDEYSGGDSDYVMVYVSAARKVLFYNLPLCHHHPILVKNIRKANKATKTKSINNKTNILTTTCARSSNINNNSSRCTQILVIFS